MPQLDTYATYSPTGQQFRRLGGVIPPAGLDMSFSANTALMTRTVKYNFGSAATSDGGVANGAASIPLTSGAALGTYFNNLGDFGQNNILIQGQMNRWSTSFADTSRYVFNAGNLSLRATLGGGTSATASLAVQAPGGVKIDGVTNNPWSSYPGITPANVTVGQIVLCQFTAGIYYVSFNDGTNFRLTAISGPTSGALANCALVFLPVYAAQLSVTAGVGATTYTFAAVPSGVAAGMYAAMWSSGGGQPNQQTWTGVSIVQSKTGTTVTVDNPNQAGSMASGTWLLFGPQILAAQLWSKAGYGAGFGGVRAVAMECNMQLPLNNGFPYNLWTDPTTIPTTAPVGCWPAWWLYSLNDGSGNIDSSEIDMAEFQASSTIGLRTYTSALHGMGSAGVDVNTGAGIGNPLWRSKATGTWRSGNPLYYFDLASGDFTTGMYAYQLLWLDDGRVYRYINGALLQGDQYFWTSSAKAQIGFDMIIGSLFTTYTGNIQVPLNSANFPMDFKIQDLSVWQM